MSTAVNATNYDMIPTEVPKEKDLVFAVIETPAGIRHKFAFEPKYGIVACPRRRKGVALKTDEFDDIDDVPAETLQGIERFLAEYSEEEGNKITFEGQCSRKDAYKLIERGHEAFAKKHGK